MLTLSFYLQDFLPQLFLNEIRQRQENLVSLTLMKTEIVQSSRLDLKREFFAS